MSNSTELKASGIFVDLENMVGGQRGVRFDIAPVMARVGKISIPVLRKAYGDWGRFAAYRHDFINEAFDQVQLFKVAVAKNGLDIQLSVEALEAIFLFPHITTIFLVTGDTDFCPLVRVLRKHGRRVIGIGWSASTGKAFREHCDEFWLYDELAGISTGRSKSITSKAMKLLLSQVTEEMGAGEWVKMSTLKDAILRRDPAFDEKQYGFSSFSHFVDTHPELQAKFSERLSDYLVRLPGGAPENTNGAGKTNGRGPSQMSEQQKFLARIRKVNMQFLGSELQDTVLRAIHELVTVKPLPLTRQEILCGLTGGSLKELVEAGQLSKNKIGGVLQVIYTARCFEIIPGNEDTPSRLELLPDFEAYDLLKRAHNVHLIRVALTGGIDLSVEEWADILLNDRTQLKRMEELIEEAQAPAIGQSST